MDVRCSAVFYCLFFGEGMPMDYGGVVSYLRIITHEYQGYILGVKAAGE